MPERYFERNWEGEYYIFDSYTISEKEFDEKVEYEDYQAFADSMTGEEVTDRLNKYNKEYLDCHNDVLRLEKENEKLKNRLKFFMELNRPYGDIIKENEQLKQSNKMLRTNVGKLTDDVKYLRNLPSTHQKENKQLKVQLEICKDARQAYKQDWKACVSYCDTYKDEIHTLKDNIQGLIEENKELKSLCKGLITHIDEKSIAFVIDEDVRRLLE